MVVNRHGATKSSWSWEVWKRMKQVYWSILLKKILSSCWFWNLELPEQKAKQKLLQRGSCFKRVSCTCSSFAIVSALEIPQVLINNYLSLGVLEWLMQKIPSSEGWYWIWLLLHVIYENFQLWALSDTSPDHLSRKPDGWKSSGWPEPN